MNNMNSEKCREQFEDWLKSTGQNPPYAIKRGYWEIWKASRQALEIAQPVLEQQDEGDWIDWEGGESPTSNLVEFKMRDGEEDRAMGIDLEWEHLGQSDDIIAYRVIKSNLEVDDEW